MSTELSVKKQDTELADLKRQVQAVIAKMQHAIESMYEGCKMYVDLIDKNTAAKELFLEAGLKESELRKMEHVGRNIMNVKLLTATGEQYRCIAKCPISEQNKYLNEPIEVLTYNGDVLKVSIDNLSKDQTKQVFADNHVRGLSEQKVYLEELKKREYIAKQPKQNREPYTISKNTVVFNNPCKLTRKEMLIILSRMD